ncbi:MAG: NAD-dependent protein deacylase, partial [Clostridia bacterium]|nr:NAD-dependent protein deacylase [Clostridia bacterium]
LIKPEVVLYGEPLDDTVWRGAMAAVSSADMLIVGGTSLSVYPAASLLEYFMGKRLVLINKTETPYDSRADLILRGPIGEVLAAAVPE